MIKIRPMEISDIDAVMDIENSSFVSPWKKEDILRELTNNEFAKLYVLELDDKVVGYYDYWITFDTATITQIAVLEEYRRNHLASSMMEQIIKDCYSNRVNDITLEVRKNNEKACKLYEKFGFRTVLIKEKYYSNGDDALYMVREMI